MMTDGITEFGTSDGKTGILDGKIASLKSRFAHLDKSTVFEIMMQKPTEAQILETKAKTPDEKNFYRELFAKKELFAQLITNTSHVNLGIDMK